MAYKVIEGVTVNQIKDAMDVAEGEGYKYVGAMTGQQSAVVIMHRSEQGQFPHGLDILRVWEMLKDAVVTDGAHHKQWYLEQIAERLKVELPDHEEGIPP